jgi:hypothetical protein
MTLVDHPTLDVTPGRYLDDDELDRNETPDCGSASRSSGSDSVDSSCACDKPILLSATTDSLRDDYDHCLQGIRLLTRVLQTPPTDRPRQEEIHNQLVEQARVCPDLWPLQNAIFQLQHALKLAQNEAATALEDAAAATQSAETLQTSCQAALSRVKALESGHERLMARNERLAVQKRVLKCAYQDLAARHYETQSQQVQAYVVTALSAHEQCLNKSTGNRSRTTTETSTASCYDGDDGLSSKCDEPTAPLESPGRSVEQPRTPGKDSARPVGFGAAGALGFGKTFNLKKKEVPLVKKEEQIVAKPTARTEPYEPIRFQHFTLPSQTSHDGGRVTDAASTTTIGDQMKHFFQMPHHDGERQTKRSHDTPLIESHALLTAVETPELRPLQNVSFGPEDSVDSGLESPLLLAEDSAGGECESMDSPPSNRSRASSWNVEACDPALLRSLSIPVHALDDCHPHLTMARKVLHIRPRKYI